MSPKIRHRLHANPFNIRGTMPRPDWLAVFGRPAPMALDIGFGDGRFTVELARRHPEWNVVGLEIRDHLVAGLQAAGRAAGVSNLHALLANANLHLDDLLPDASVCFVAVNFPDPWFKNRHHKRRVVRPDWTASLRTKLMAGAEVHAMTDFEPVGREILEVMEGTPGFVNVEGPGKLAAVSTTGIETEREVTHMTRGEPIYRMQFRYEPTCVASQYPL